MEGGKDAEVIDEAPVAYKSIDLVMQAQRDLVEVVHAASGGLRKGLGLCSALLIFSELPYCRPDAKISFARRFSSDFVFAWWISRPYDSWHRRLFPKGLFLVGAQV